MSRSFALRQLALLLAGAAFPAAAAAAPFGELPFQRLPDGTGCLAPTGAPGELSRWGEGGPEVLVAGPEGLGAPIRVPLGTLPGCPRIAADGSGAGVAAGATKRALRVALREPGGAGFAAPVTLAPAAEVFELSVAVSPSGDAAVAWAEGDAASRRVRLRIARRVAGGAFTAPVDLVPWTGDGPVGVQVGMAADGETIVFVREPAGDPERFDGLETLRIAPAGAPLGPPAPVPAELDASTLRVAPDGRAILAGSGGAGVAIVERAPGAAFGPVQRLTPEALSSISPTQFAVAFGPGPRAVVAWHDGDAGTTGAAVREGAAFGPPVVIVPAPESLNGFGGGAGEPLVPELPPLQAALAADGRVSVAWSDGAARVATVAGGGVVERARLGSPLREAHGVSLVTLGDGRRALAWTNEERPGEPGPARVHYAVEGTPPAPGPAAPRITIGAPRERALRPAQALVLPVGCSAACDFTVSVPGTGAAPVQRSLRRAGRVRVTLPAYGRAIAPRRPGPVRVVVRSSAPGARTATRTVRRVRLRRLPALPLPRIEDVRTRRLPGGRLEVRWRTGSDARDTFFYVVGTRTRAEDEDDEAAVDGLYGSRRRAYRVVLEGASELRFVRVHVIRFVGKSRRSVTVRLR